ncbi:MAG TPA: hypothetical protein VFL83_18135 [Anaeromyxobacter sp.]|nr:hypothetical protein [Anaeromyxobacter sp.]
MRPIAAALLALASGLTPCLASALPPGAEALPGTAVAFRKHEIGVALANRTLPSVADGKRLPVLQEGRVSVIVFVRTGQDHSQSALRQLAELEREMDGRSVRFAAIVSDTEPRDEVRALVSAAGIRMPVLVDEADALYGELGVAMHPSAGVFGKDRRLVGFQPFRKINYLDAMRGQVRLALGEIDQAALARILDPAAAPVASGGRAHARLKLARTLLAAGLVEQGIENARAAIAIDPELADAHAVLAEALAKGGRCDESARELVAARRLARGADVPAPACSARAAR